MRALVFAACLVAAACPAARAQQVHAYAALASDYVDRGVALGGDGPLLQLGAEVAWSSGVVAGVFSTTLDRAWTRDRAPANAELDAYFGYDFGCGRRCRARVLVTRYVFPDRDAAGWTEWSVAVAPHPRFGASLAYAREVYALPFPGRTLEAWYEHALTPSLSAGVAAGRIRTRFFDYGYARVGATYRHDRFAADLSYHVADDEYRRNGFIDDLHHVVATLTWAW